MERRTCNTFLHEIIGLFIISRLTVSALLPPKYMFNLEFAFPQFAIQLWATRALWWALMRIPSFPAHHWNTQTNSERRAYCVIMKQIYVLHSKWGDRDDREFTADELGCDLRSSRGTTTCLSVSVRSAEPAACLPGENSAFVWHPHTQPVWSRVSATSSTGSNIRGCKRVHCDGGDKSVPFK